MDRLTANFYPASEPKEYDGGVYLGKAHITIANAFRLNDISVFMTDAGKLNINFPEYESGGEQRSFVIPKSPEAYAAMCDVIESAKDSDQGFAFAQGTYNPQLMIHGGLTNEEYADGRFSVEVGEVCTLVGLATRKAQYEVDGETKKFVAVDLPNIIGPDGHPSTYEKDGQIRYNKVFDPLVSSWTNQEGQKKSKDFGRLLNRLVLNERKALLEAEKGKAQEGIDQKMEQAQKRSKAGKSEKAPERELEMA